MAFFGKKKHKNVELLIKQSPRLRGRSRQHLLRKLSAALFLSTLIGFAGYWAIKLIVLPKIVAQRQLREPLNLRILIDSAKNQLLSAGEKDQLRNQLIRLLNSQENLNLQSISARLLRNSSYEEILLLRQNNEQLYVKVWKRNPVLITMVDTLRYITATGVIYGNANEDENKEKLPRLKGLFTDPNRQYPVSANNQITVTPSEQQILSEAGALVEMLAGEDLNTDEIEFILHRGFFCQIAANNTLVAFGRAPFSKKISKLHKVLAHLADKGARAQRIELDYFGKAFIKEKLP